MPPGEETLARSFFIDVLGMTEVPKPAELLSRGGVWFRSGDVFLHLGVDHAFRAATKAHPAFRCAGYDALLKRIHSHGVPVKADERLIEGRRHCYVSDPFGNRIELIDDP